MPGGYSFRLCPASARLTERCFQQRPLPFVPGRQALRLANGTELAIGGRYTTEGTTPAGSSWAQNPLPNRVCTNATEPSSCSDPQAFPPPCNEDVGKMGNAGRFCSGGGPGERVLIVDTLRIPPDTPAGDYVLGYRWDCEISAQVWSACADVRIVKTDDATVDVQLGPSAARHPLNPLHHGCHMDLGFAHPARGIYSQLLYGGSFEFGDAGYGGLGGPEHNGRTDIAAAAQKGIVWNALLPSSSADGLGALVRDPPKCSTAPQPCPSHPGRTYCLSDPAAGQCEQPSHPPCPPCPPPALPIGPPPPSTNDGGTVSFITNTSAHHGLSSLELKLVKGAMVGATNRGMGNEGLSLVPQTTYEGYFFVRADSAARMAVMLRNHRAKKVLARQDLAVAATHGAFQRVNFSFVTSAGTGCEGIASGSDPTVNCGQHCVDKASPPLGPAHLQNSGCMAPPANNEQGHICIRCDGEFVIALTTPGATVHVDYAFLQPGRELRAGDGPFLKSGADALRSMGVRAIRVGGGFAGPDYYFWKRWTGEPSARPSDGAKWGSCLLSGFGPFEAIDLCEELGIEPVITTSAMGGPDYRRCLGAGPPHDHHGSGLPCSCCNASDMGDLIEYAWGDASTTWGRQRIADGHERPYKVRYIELGNVRSHLTSLCAIVARVDR